MVRRWPATRDGSTMNSDGPPGSPAPCGALPAVQRNGASQVTAFTQSAPSIFAEALAFSTSAWGLTSPVAMTPRITPTLRSTRVSARVSTSAMATMPLVFR
jgi:hypothetical protein